MCIRDSASTAWLVNWEENHGEQDNWSMHGPLLLSLQCVSLVSPSSVIYKSHLGKNWKAEILTPIAFFTNNRAKLGESREAHCTLIPYWGRNMSRSRNSHGLIHGVHIAAVMHQVIQVVSLFVCTWSTCSCCCCRVWCVSYQRSTTATSRAAAQYSIA